VTSGVPCCGSLITIAQRTPRCTGVLSATMTNQPGCGRALPAACKRTAILRPGRRNRFKCSEARNLPQILKLFRKMEI